MRKPLERCAMFERLIPWHLSRCHSSYGFKPQKHQRMPENFVLHFLVQGLRIHGHGLENFRVKNLGGNWETISVEDKLGGS